MTLETLIEIFDKLDKVTEKLLSVCSCIEIVSQNDTKNMISKIYIKQETIQKLAKIAKQDIRIKQNLLLKERKIIRTVLNKYVGFNDSDKNFQYCTLGTSTWNNVKNICMTEKAHMSTLQNQKI